MVQTFPFLGLFILVTCLTVASHPENGQVPSVSDIWIPTAVTSLYSSSGHARASTCAVYIHTRKLAKSKSRPRYLYSESSVPIFIIYLSIFLLAAVIKSFSSNWNDVCCCSSSSGCNSKIEIRKKDGLPPGGSSWASTQLREFTNSRKEKKKKLTFSSFQIEQEEDRGACEESRSAAE